MKNDSIKPIKRYEVGGASDDSCMEEYVAADGKKRKRRKSKCGKTKTVRVKSSGSSTVGRDILLGLGAAAAGGFGLKKMLNQEKKGGVVKKKYQAGGGASIVAAMKKGGAAKKKK